MNSSTNTSGLNISTVPSSPIDAVMVMRATAAFGLLAAIENIAIILIMLTTKTAWKFSALLLGLTLGHALNGLMHAITYWPKPISFQIMTRFSCLTSSFNPWITFYQLLPVILAMTGMERLLAVAAPMWFRSHCTHRRVWILTIATFVGAFLLMVINILRVWLAPDPPLRFGCYPPDVLGTDYMIYGVHGLGVLGGVLATVWTLTGVFLGGRRLRRLPAASKGEIARMKRQIRLTKCVFMVSCIDMVCVVVPHFILVLINLGVPVPAEFSSFPVLLYCMDSALNIVAYVLFNREFREACVRLLQCNRVTMVESLSVAAPTMATVMRRGRQMIK